MRKLFSTLTAIVMVAFIVDAAQAATKVWQASGSNMGGNWNDTNHWVGGVIPIPGSDDVQFPANSVSANTQYIVTLNVSNAEVRFLDMHTDAKLNLNGNTFKLGTSDGQTSNVAGVIRLPDSSSMLEFNFSHTLAPKTISSVPVYGSIDGENDLASIKIANGKTLTNQITIQGAIQIVPVSGSATFTNGSGGIVLANYNTGGQETLRINPGALGAGAGMFRVALAGAILRFDYGNASLTGDFKVSAGTLDARATLATSGGLCFTGGAISVVAGASFGATGAPTNCP